MNRDINEGQLPGGGDEELVAAFMGEFYLPLTAESEAEDFLQATDDVAATLGRVIAEPQFDFVMALAERVIMVEAKSTPAASDDLQSLSDGSARIRGAHSAELTADARAEAVAIRTAAETTAKEIVASANALAGRIVTAAEDQAAALITSAQAEADHITTVAIEKRANIIAEGERELAALRSRRESINAQLTSVREMLATLTGASVAAAQADETHGEEAEAAQQVDGPVKIPQQDGGVSVSVRGDNHFEIPQQSDNWAAGSRRPRH